MSTWYVSRAGQQSEPLTLEQVQQMWQAGELGPDAYVSGPGLSDWTPAAQVPMLAQAAAPPAASPPAGGFPPGAPPEPQAGFPPAQPNGGQPFGHGQPPQPMGQMGGAMGAPPQQPNAAFPLGAPDQAGGPGPRGERQSSWVGERLRGLAAVGVALLLLIVNVATIMNSSSFYPKTIIIGLGALCYGGWVIIFGDEYDDFTLELVRWKQIGMYACGGIGVVIGIIISVMIAE